MKIGQAIAATAIALTMGVSAASAVPTQVGTLTFGGNTFKAWAESDGISWDDADVFATANSSHLATLDTPTVNAAVYALVGSDAGLWNSNGLGPWIGGFQTTPGTFQWSNGETLATDNWGAGQPDDAEGEPEAVLFYPSGGTWGDYGAACGESGSPSICQAGSVFGFVTEQSVPEPLTLSLFGAGLAGAAAMRRRRKTNKA